MQHAEPEDYAEVQEGLDPNQVHEVNYCVPPCIWSAVKHLAMLQSVSHGAVINILK